MLGCLRFFNVKTTATPYATQARRLGSANREMGRRVRLVLGAAIFDSIFFKKDGIKPIDENYSI
ncbi:hypothetical protein D5R40_34000 [Okeania hirsuta]|uniref:Uncharacterized protein n=1 Tax=Okeania hirsuta TaxID=1458930 RepID=A0A3N6P0H0_9CYAN|nr:hypothetical protein D5R40_34000 [Okeania hirsuta]